MYRIKSNKEKEYENKDIKLCGYAGIISGCGNGCMYKRRTIRLWWQCYHKFNATKRKPDMDPAIGESFGDIVWDIVGVLY
jgi:hypothetical protein